MQKIFKFITSVCTVFGAILLIFLGIVIWFQWGAQKSLYIPKHSVMVIDFSDSFSEKSGSSIVDELLDKKVLSLNQLIKSIEIAQTDDRIDGIVARIDTSDLELAQIQDVARAIAQFRKSGKKTIAFSQGFGPFGKGNREYYLASFFEKIYMQPHTTIGLTGIDAEIPFAREVLDKIGVNPEFYTRYEYKSAMASFTDKQISAPFKQNMNEVIAGLMNEIKQDIVANRKLSADDIDTLINQAPLSSEAGKNSGLIDDLLYLPELEDMLKKEGIENYVAVADYAAQIVPNSGDLPTIAVLNINGIIDTGESSTDFDGDFVIGSRSVLADLGEIEELDNLKALVVRIDSPGGSYNAADEIYFALKNLKNKKQIPIIISQGGYAASGGYFISLAGDVIVAEPTTITGSIGVLGGKFDLQKLWQKIGINWADIKQGNNADILSINKPFSATEQKIFNQSLDEVYADFIKKVEENRKLSKNINDIARGRVWTGRQALQLGLVDAMGGFDNAVAIAMKMAQISPETKIKIVAFPAEKSFGEKISELIFSGNVRTRQILEQSGVDIRYLKLFKRLQYDSVLLPFILNL